MRAGRRGSASSHAVVSRRLARLIRPSRPDAGSELRTRSGTKPASPARRRRFGAMGRPRVSRPVARTRARLVFRSLQRRPSEDSCRPAPHASGVGSRPPCPVGTHAARDRASAPPAVAWRCPSQPGDCERQGGSAGRPGRGDRSERDRRRERVHSLVLALPLRPRLRSGEAKPYDVAIHWRGRNAFAFARDPPDGNAGIRIAGRRRTSANGYRRGLRPEDPLCASETRSRVENVAIKDRSRSRCRRCCRG